MNAARCCEYFWSVVTDLREVLSVFLFDELYSALGFEKTKPPSLKLKRFFFSVCYCCDINHSYSCTHEWILFVIAMAGLM